MHSLVIPVIRKPEYQVSIEQWADWSFLHCDIRKWNHTVAKRLRKDFESFCALHGGPFRALDNGSPTQSKFLKHFGFRLIDFAFNAEGVRMPLYERPSDGQPIRRWQSDHQH